MTVPAPVEPGVILVGEWAHVRWAGHHLVVADEPELDSWEPVRMACGKRFAAWRVWHRAPEPHLTRCKGCARTTAGRVVDLPRVGRTHAA